MFEHIFHPSDFTQTSQVAFYHALKIALAVHAELKMLHVDATHEHSHYRDFPSVLAVLERWKVLPAGSSPRSVGKLGIDIEKEILHDSQPIETISEFLTDNPSSLVVLAAHQRSKWAWFSRSKAEPIARIASATTLFVPDGVQGFVSAETGAVQLRNILIPIAVHPNCLDTVESVCQLVNSLSVTTTDLHFLYVGPETSLPAIPQSLPNNVRSHVHVQQGDIVQSILTTSRELEADLIAMTTDGHRGFLDALRGTTTEQVLRQIHCPLWAVTSR
jgi:nucleotide-binding universal stress UspA family protein